MTPQLNGPMLEKYEQLVADLDVIVWEADARTFQFTFVSQQAERLLGYPLELWLTPGFWSSHLHPDDRSWAVDFCREATRQKRKHDFEYRMVAADGRTAWLRDIVSVVVEGGEATRLRGIMVDITDRKRTEEALRESELLYRLLTENSNDLIYLLDLEGRILYTSPSVGRLLGRVPASKFEVIHPEDVAAAQVSWGRVLAGEKDLLSVRVRDARGEWHWLEASSSLIHYHGRPHVLSVCRDVSDRKRAEEVIRHQLRMNEAMFSQAITCFVLLDRDFRFIRVNEAFARHYRKSPEDFVGREYFDVIPYEGAPTTTESIRAEILRTKQPLRAQARPYVFADQPERGPTYWDWTLQPILDGQGEVEFFFFSSVEVTERVRAEEATRDAERQLRTLVENYPDFIARFDRDCRHLYVSPAVARAFGDPAEDIVGRTLRELPKSGSAEQIESLETGIRLAFEQGLPNTREATWSPPQGERVFEVRHIPEHDERGRVVSVMGITRDITERKRAEEALRVSETRFRTFVDHATDAFFLHDAEGTVLDANRQACEGLGYAREELIGMTPLDFDPDISPEALRGFLGRLDAGELLTFESSHRRKDGTLFPVEVRIRPFYDGGHRRAVSLVQDISERKRAEESLAAQQAELRNLAESSPGLMATYYLRPDGSACMPYTSPRIWDLFGLKSEEVVNDAGPLLARTHPDDANLVRDTIAESGRNMTPWRLEYRILHPTRGEIWLESSSNPKPHPDGGVIWYGFAHDISERKRVEERLRQSEGDLKLALDAGRLGDWRWDLVTGRITWSPLCKALHGLPPDAELTHDQFLAVIHPGDRDRIAAAMRRALEGDEDYEEENRTVWPDGSVHWTAARGRVYRDGSGRPVHMSGVTMDVTERKRAEELLRASLEDKVVLLKEVHHRVKNNLQLVSSLLALQAAAIKDKAVREALTDSQNRVRAMAMVHENLYRSRDLTSVSIAPHIESLCAHLWRSYGVDAGRVEPELRIAPLALELDRALRCGLIVNELVSNALKHAFPAGRPGRIAVELDEQPDGWYALVISDDGVGLPPGLDPGHTNTLGLQLVSDLAAQLNGTLTLKRDSGAAFTVRFPEAQS